MAYEHSSINLQQCERPFGSSSAVKRLGREIGLVKELVAIILVLLVILIFLLLLVRLLIFHLILLLIIIIIIIVVVVAVCLRWSRLAVLQLLALFKSRYFVGLRRSRMNAFAAFD